MLIFQTKKLNTAGFIFVFGNWKKHFNIEKGTYRIRKAFGMASTQGSRHMAIMLTSEYTRKSIPFPALSLKIARNFKVMEIPSTRSHKLSTPN